jgi:thiamine biosynthesis lipoprotein
MRPRLIRCGSLLSLTILAGAGCRPLPGEFGELTTFTGQTMGTGFTVKIVDPPPTVSTEALEEEIAARLGQINGWMSTYDSDSELSRLNRFEQPEWFEVSAETASVIDEALRVGRLTDGAFDVTVGPLVNLWNFGPVRRDTDRVPPSDEIDEVRARTGLEKVEVRLSPPAVRKLRGDVSIDLSGIAKGYAVDEIAGLLERSGVENYMVDVGGEVKARGRNPKGKPWQIAIESPVAGTREIHKVIPLDRLAVATSGDYRNYFEQEGIRYAHVIDPRSGSPITHKLASVSVLDPSCMRADGLATGLMVLGPEAGYNLALREELPVLFLVKSETGFVERMTPQFEQVIETASPR